MLRKSKINAEKTWPADCIWPKPLYDGDGIYWDEDIAGMTYADEVVEKLLSIKEYYDSLVSCDRLNDDYTLSEYYYDADDEPNEDTVFEPEVGEEYWDNGFMYDVWEDDLADHMNQLKLCTTSAVDDPVISIRDIIGYDFINENLLRQAFTRRAFAIEHKLSGNNEELEFLGDSVLNNVVTREIMNQLAKIKLEMTDAPLQTEYNEGDLTRIRSGFVSKEHLAARAEYLGLDKYILYGTGEEATESSREDAIEALIGAVAIDSGYNEAVLESVVDRLVCIQLEKPDLLLRKTFYESFNAWHQKHFGKIPEYTIQGRDPYWCTIRFLVPENDIGVDTYQRIDMSGETRGKSRELAAEFAYRFVSSKGLWVNLKDAGIVPDLENSINQLQELYQKKYLDERPVYEIQEDGLDRWRCDCECCGIGGHGSAENKTKAKKKASYMVLVKLLDSTGCCKEEWLSKMYEML